MSGRRTFRQVRGVFVEVTRQATDRSSDAQHHGALFNDREYEGLRASDGADISTRKKHRDYMHRTGLTTACDFKNEWAAAEKKREKFFRAEPDPVRRRDIERALHDAGVD